DRVADVDAFHRRAETAQRLTDRRRRLRRPDAEMRRVELAEETVRDEVELLRRRGVLRQNKILIGQRRPVEILHGRVVEELAEHARQLSELSRRELLAINANGRVDVDRL